jgi:phosphate acetyltransferase
MIITPIMSAKSKNVTIGMAKDLMEDVSYFGTMMVYKDHADGMVSGAHTTQHIACLAVH